MIRINILKRTTSLFYLGLALLIGFSIFDVRSVSARENRLTILPFRVAGRPNPSLFSEPEIPRMMQEASYFLFSELKPYPLSSIEATRVALNEAGFKPEHPIDSSVARAVCTQTQGSLFLAGAIQFINQKDISLTLATYSCSGGSVLARATRTGSIEKMQQLLKQAIIEATPFAPTSTSVNFELPVKPLPVDAAVIVDLSGSMSEELPSIYKALEALRYRLPLKSRIGIIGLRADGNIDVLPFSEHWESVLEGIRKRPASGEVPILSLDRALEKVESFRDWRGKSRLLIFTDVNLGGARQERMENRLRRLNRRGVSVRLFQLKNQHPKDRSEWRRVARVLNMETAPLYYGRRVGFLQGFSLFFIQSGERFFTSDRDITSDLIAGDLDLTSLVPIETSLYSSDHLNLGDLPLRYAARENLKVTGMAPVISNMENVIKYSLLEGEAGAPLARYRALVKNEGQSFWIRFNDPVIFRNLLSRRGDTLYLGLHLSASGQATEGLSNLPSPIYIREQKNVPSIFINRWSHLQSQPPASIHHEDVWFFLVQIKEVEDARKGQDIRGR